ncbi:MAG: adenosine kinase [Bacteroidales bacterium]|nr:adenosine kinase [Bacteroidales bacterium]
MKKILGLGNALVDIMTQLDHDEYLPFFKLPKGSMILVDGDRSEKIYDATMHLEKTVRSGGSAANTIHGLANLGVESGFIGKIGTDDMGKVFHDDLVAAGIRAHLSQSNTSTGRAIALVSPDTERTFATYLGAAVELTAADFDEDVFKAYEILHIEGYLVQNQSMLLKAVQLAKKNNLMVSLDMASYNVVAENREFLEHIIRRYVDIVFANEEEARAFTGKAPAEALEALAEHTAIAVVKTGRNGSLVKKGMESLCIGIIEVNSIDTTGAGDLYAAGFLYGMVKGYDILKAGTIGALLAGKVIEVVGPKLDDARWGEVKRELNIK